MFVADGGYRIAALGRSQNCLRRTRYAAGEHTSVRQSGLTADHRLARSFLEPLLRAGSAVRTARPTTRTAFARLKFLDRALDSAAARCFLFGRDDPTNPFVPRERRQILPSRPRLCFRADRYAQVVRSFVHGTGLACSALVHRFNILAGLAHALGYMSKEQWRWLGCEKSFQSAHSEILVFHHARRRLSNGMEQLSLSRQRNGCAIESCHSRFANPEQHGTLVRRCAGID